MCLALTACGSHAPKRLTNAQFAARANTICARFHRQADTVGDISSLRQLDRATTKTLSLLRTATRALRKLRPPESEEAEVHRWLRSLDVLTRDLVKLRERARANDLGGVHRIANASLAHDTRTDTLARRVGATSCATSR
jgi:hypothetical protein